MSVRQSVCVRLKHVARCVSNLKGTPILVACVVGFHEGTHDTREKLKEARAAVDAGARELDIVLNWSILARAGSGDAAGAPAQPATMTAPAQAPAAEERKRKPAGAAGHHQAGETVATLGSDIDVSQLTATNTAANRRPTLDDAPPAVGPYSVITRASSSPPPPPSLPTASVSTTSSSPRKRSPSTSASASTAPAVAASAASAEPVPDYSAIYRELAALRSLCPTPTTLKLIVETSQLTAHQTMAASHLAAAANFDFVKTSTGFCGRGATTADVALLAATAGHLATCHPPAATTPANARKMRVKASGGIRCLDDAVAMLDAGAARLGTSSGLWIMQEARKIVKEGERGVSPLTAAAATAQRPPGMTRLYTDNSIDEY